MKTMVLWELRQRKMAIFWWTVVSLVLVAVILGIYPSLHHNAQVLEKTLNQLPNGIRQLKNGNSSLDVGSPVGFLNSQLFYITLPLLYIILTVTRGSALVGREEQSHTLELLLARPISRGQLLAGKAASLVLELGIITTITTLAILGLGHLVDIDIAVSRLIITSVYTALFCLSFGALSFALVAFGRLTKRSSTAIAVTIAFGGYLLASLSGLSHWLVNPAKLAPYHYFLPVNTLQGYAVHGLDSYLIGIFALTALAAYFGFRHRDID